MLNRWRNSKVSPKTSVPRKGVLFVLGAFVTQPKPGQEVSKWTYTVRLTQSLANGP